MFASETFVPGGKVQCGAALLVGFVLVCARLQQLQQRRIITCTTHESQLSNPLPTISSPMLICNGLDHTNTQVGEDSKYFEILLD